MRAYKYISAEDAHYIESGSLKLGTPEHYAAIEGARRDPLDSCIVYQNSGTITVSGNPGEPDYEQARASAARMGISVEGPASRITIVRGQGRFRAPPFLIFCMCLSAENAFAASDGAQAVFEIPDVEALTQAMGDAAAVELWRCIVRPVDYQPRILDPRVEGGGASPFIKGPKFAAEEELRAVFDLQAPPPAAGWRTIELGARPDLLVRLR